MLQRCQWPVSASSGAGHSTAPCPGHSLELNFCFIFEPFCFRPERGICWRCSSQIATGTALTTTLTSMRCWDREEAHLCCLRKRIKPGLGDSDCFIRVRTYSSIQIQFLQGLYVYHCAAAPIPQHIANGMYGLLLVEPKSGPGILPPVDREFYVMQSEFYTEPSLVNQEDKFIFHNCRKWMRQTCSSIPTAMDLKNMPKVWCSMAERGHSPTVHWWQTRANEFGSILVMPAPTWLRPSTSLVPSLTESTVTAAFWMRLPMASKHNWCHPAVQQLWKWMRLCRAHSRWFVLHYDIPI